MTLYVTAFGLPCSILLVKIRILLVLYVFSRDSNRWACRLDCKCFIIDDENSQEHQQPKLEPTQIFKSIEIVCVGEHQKWSR